MKILESVYFAQNDIIHLQIFDPRWDNGAKLPGFNFASHGISPWPKLNSFASPESVNVSGGPTHNLEGLIITDLPANPRCDGLRTLRVAFSNVVEDTSGSGIDD